MKVLVTGGAGYIGTELIYELAKRKEVNEIVIYDNLAKGYNLFTGYRKVMSDKVSFIEGDILDSRKMKKALNGVNIVYHLAAHVAAPYAEQNSHIFEQVNHWGTAELIYAIEDSSVSQLIFLSSAGVYGSLKKPATAETPPNPRTFYGISKMRGEEHVLRAASDKLKTLVLRCSNVFGYSKNMRFDAVINKFMYEANFLGRIQVHGNGGQYRAFIHINRVVEALCGILGTNLETGVYNLTDKNLTILDIVETMKALYPELEMIFVNQHLQLREVRIEQDPRLDKLFTSKPQAFGEELKGFKEMFTF